MTKSRIDLVTIHALKEELVRDGIEKIVVGAIIVVDSRVLFLRRKAGDFMAGLVELPSGTVDPGEDLLDALVRETKEETSMDVSLVEKYTGAFDYASGSGKKTRQLNFRVQAVGCVQVSPDEHDVHFWVDPGSSDFNTLNISDEIRKSIRDAL
ncbi:MAG: NUDIX domain-containing protein [Candidatus Andersenbacteria bacterium]